MPPPGSPAQELRVARFRGHARRLGWSALVLIAVAGACGYFYGNLPAPLENWMLLTAAAAVVFFLVVLPLSVWWSRVYTVTTRRVMSRAGLFAVRRHELDHVRGYTIQLRRGLLQRMWGAGTLTLSNGVDEPLRIVNVPSAVLVHETLVDQVEVAQILAHREAPAMMGIPPVSSTPPPLPGTVA